MGRKLSHGERTIGMKNILYKKKRISKIHSLVLKRSCNCQPTPLSRVVIQQNAIPYNELLNWRLVMTVLSTVMSINQLHLLHNWRKWCNHERIKLFFVMSGQGHYTTKWLLLHSIYYNYHQFLLYITRHLMCLRACYWGNFPACFISLRLCDCVTEVSASADFGQNLAEYLARSKLAA